MRKAPASKRVLLFVKWMFIFPLHIDNVSIKIYNILVPNETTYKKGGNDHGKTKLP